MYLLWNVFEIKISGAVKRNTPHSPLVCSMLNEMAQYLKLVLSIVLQNVFPDVMIMTSAS